MRRPRQEFGGAILAFIRTPNAGKGTPVADFAQHPIHQPILSKAAQSEITSVYAMFEPFALIGLAGYRRADVPNGSRRLGLV